MISLYIVKTKTDDLQIIILEQHVFFINLNLYYTAICVAIWMGFCFTACIFLSTF